MVIFSMELGSFCTIAAQPITANEETQTLQFNLGADHLSQELRFAISSEMSRSHDGRAEGAAERVELHGVLRITGAEEISVRQGVDPIVISFTSIFFTPEEFQPVPYHLLDLADHDYLVLMNPIMGVPLETYRIPPDGGLASLRTARDRRAHRHLTSPQQAVEDPFLEAWCARFVQTLFPSLIPGATSGRGWATSQLSPDAQSRHPGDSMRSDNTTQSHADPTREQLVSLRYAEATLVGNAGIPTASINRRGEAILDTELGRVLSSDLTIDYDIDGVGTSVNGAMTITMEAIDDL